MQPADMLTTQTGQFLPTTTQNSEVEYPTDFEPFENHYDGNNPFLKPFADQMNLSLQQRFTDIRFVQRFSEVATLDLDKSLNQGR